jgi:hypothetical protein
MTSTPFNAYADAVCIAFHVHDQIRFGGSHPKPWRACASLFQKKLTPSPFGRESASLSPLHAPIETDQRKKNTKLAPSSIVEDVSAPRAVHRLHLHCLNRPIKKLCAIQLWLSQLLKNNLLLKHNQPAHQPLWRLVDVIFLKQPALFSRYQPSVLVLCEFR